MVNALENATKILNNPCLKVIVQGVGISLLRALFTNCDKSNDGIYEDEGTHTFEIYPKIANEKNNTYALVDPGHSSIYLCPQTFNLPDESASYEWYYSNGTPNENGSIFQISTSGNNDTRRGHTPIGSDKKVIIYTEPITSHLSFIVKDPNIKVEKMIALSPDSVYLTNLDPADKDLTLEIPANRLNGWINVLTKSEQSLNMYAKIGNEPYLLKAKFEKDQLEPWKEYTIFIDSNENTWAPYMYLVLPGETRATSSYTIPEQEVKTFWKDDVRTDDVMRNTNDENFSTNYIWNGDWKNGNTDL